MEKKRNGQTIIIAVLAVAILFMSVGFAAYAQTLRINGDVSVDAAKWDIHWDKTTYTKSNGSVDILGSSREAGSTPVFDNTSVSFGAVLKKPGDYAEFSIDAVNEGTFNANLTSITLTPELTDAQKEYLSYSVTYNGVEYTSSRDGLSVPLNPGDSNKVTVKVKVNYLQPEDSTKLPQTVQNISLTALFNYNQAE